MSWQEKRSYKEELNGKYSNHNFKKSLLSSSKIEPGIRVLQIIITSLSWENKFQQNGEFGENQFRKQAWIKHFRQAKETRRFRNRIKESRK